MLRRRTLQTLAVTAVALLAAPAMAQSDCECDCYFSFDCNSGAFCDYGGSFTIQDECWWRTPKPQGAPGVGCDSDYGDWGQCDGKCDSTGAVGAAIAGENEQNLVRGVSLWAQTLDGISLKGGGVPSADAIRQVDALDFVNPTLTYGLWRMVTEVMILSRGSDYVVFPKEGGFLLWDVSVADLRGHPAVQRNGELAIATLLAEIAAPGSGETILADLDTSVVDHDLLGRVCGEASVVDCMYGRLVDMATVLRGEPDPTDGGVQPSCAGCMADITASDEVDFADLLALLAAWDETGGSPADLNGDERVDFQDLLSLLSAWGPCAL